MIARHEQISSYEKHFLAKDRMTPLVPIMLFGWVPFSIFLFSILKPHQAVLVAVIGGTLFLPMTGYDFPSIIPPFTKGTSIAIGLVLGGRISRKRRKAQFHWKLIDLPMLLWCTIPLATSLSNNLGWYEGVSGLWNTTMVWGVPYFAGRIYFDSMEKLQDLCRALVIGGLIYIPLCLYEIRMSPQLSNMVYGFFPHIFAQQRRYGGFRPVVFMQHGLMVSLWMATTTTAAFWLWRSGFMKSVKGLSMSLFVPLFILTTILCKSVNGWFAMLLGFASYFLYKSCTSIRPFQVLLLIIPFYIALRISGVLAGSTIENFASQFVDISRLQSLELRLHEEDLFIQKMLQRPLLGWGRIGRARQVSSTTGEKIGIPIDALWLIVVSLKGMFGLGSLFLGMLIGPWRALRYLAKKSKMIGRYSIFPLLLSLIVMMFLIDSLMNGMINQVYIVISGALSGWSTLAKAGKTTT